MDYFTDLGTQTELSALCDCVELVDHYLKRFVVKHNNTESDNTTIESTVTPPIPSTHPSEDGNMSCVSDVLKDTGSTPQEKHSQRSSKNPIQQGRTARSKKTKGKTQKRVVKLHFEGFVVK